MSEQCVFKVLGLLSYKGPAWLGLAVVMLVGAWIAYLWTGR